MTAATIAFESALEVIHDVIVVGAGPAGAVAAQQIARRGISVLLVDRHQFPRYKLCGACLNGSAVAELRRLGIGSQLDSLAGLPLNQFELHSGSRQLNLQIAGGMAVSRERLDSMLVQEAISAGANFLSGITLSVAAATGEGFRILRQRHDKEGKTLRAKVVVVASGLSSDSRPEDPALQTCPSAGARFGAGTKCTSFPEYYQNGTIFMAAGDSGYVGLTRIEDGSLNIAAALDQTAVRNSCPATVCRNIVENCGLPVCDDMFAGDWKGTVGLTRRTRNSASERLFVVGDAAGYVEPFTGEGMAWAIRGGCAVAPLVESAVHSWDAGLCTEWNASLRRLVTRRQRWCRRLATALRYPKLVRSLMGVVSVVPGIGRALARRIYEEN